MKKMLKKFLYLGAALGLLASTITSMGQVVAVDTDGGQNLPRKGIQIEKVDSKNENQKLAGAIFKVSDANGTEVATVITDSKGIASVAPLPLGVYRIEEITPPSGYKLPENPVGTIDLTQGNEPTVHYKVKNKKRVTGVIDFRKLSDVPCPPGFNPSVVIQVPSNNGGVVVKSAGASDAPQGCYVSSTIIYQQPPSRGGVVVKSRAANEKSSSTVYALAGVVFALRQGNQELYTATSDGHGIVRFEDIPEGTYTLVEKSTVDGYAINFEPREVTIDEDHQYISLGNIENKQIKGSVKVTKVDADDKSKLLPGVVFALKQGDKEIARATTDANGVALFEGLTKGTYTLTEVSTVDGYVLSQESREIVISELDQVVEVADFENRPIKGSVKVTKVDADDKAKVLPGVVFVLKQGDKIIAEAKTDSNGIATFKDIVHGTYTLAEKSTIDGYALSNETREVTISEDGAVVELGTFTNKKKPTPTPPPSSSTPSTSSSTEPSSSTSTSSSTEPSSSTSTSSTSLPPSSGSTPPPVAKVPGKRRMLLPRTGTTTSIWMGVLGFALLVLAGFVYRTRKD
ncbi:hypothetical protein BU202_01410 [Streptococcus cuniculi]|uniref:Gram-positive cocci surface proteins LPxTG domain-containing protein n=1 Tax=Streptococcus cuniculi TaxID=1432788 RepID=A0A1Q8EAY8_9STRE|nr:LPXTG cell wall anchor domain-containing protein [Streptococcus cuniculi]OLF48969.1 hypothetical protein BU202_01410 [Streptococcus cuniculi]